jgi:hypothetical protein
MRVFDCKGGVLVIAMNTPENSGISYEKDFAKILTSINFDGGLVSGSPVPSSTEKQKDYTLTAGRYKVGKDIPEGTYDIVWVSGSGNCFTQGVNEIFGDNEKYEIKQYKNAELGSGTEVKITSTLKVKFVSK